MFPHLLIKPIQSLRKSKKLKEICRQVSLPRSWWRRGCKFNFPPWRSTCLSLPFYSHRGADGESIQDNSEIWRCRGLKNLPEKIRNHILWWSNLGDCSCCSAQRSPRGSRGRQLRHPQAPEELEKETNARVRWLVGNFIEHIYIVQWGPK